tara:strand:+ start:881 stop:2128 length:1248 start_codon:yes stop_codon:yes gene_type:complete
MKLDNIKYINCFNNKKFKKEYKEILQTLAPKVFNDSDLKKLKFLNQVKNQDHFNQIEKITKKFKKNFNKFCILGTGGSSLGSQAIIGMNQKNKNNNIIFLYDIDPTHFQNILNSLNVDKTAFIVISKSGKTPETLAQFGAIINKFEKLKIKSKIKKNFLVITEDKENPLKILSDKLKIKILIHHREIGGRFSVFSNVGLLPAALAGIDIKSFLLGGKKILDDFFLNKNVKPIESAIIMALMQKYFNININVLFTYSEALKNFGIWYRQLWAESLGKQGKGITPFHSMGTIDQHSQLQLFLDGPKDKFYTFIKSNHLNKGPIISPNYFSKSEMKYLSGKKIGDLMEAEQNATIKTLINKNLPIKEIFMKKIDAESLGSLMMYSFLEVICMGKIFKVNIFNQPAIEEGKKIAKKFLS